MRTCRPVSLGKIARVCLVAMLLSLVSLALHPGLQKGENRRWGRRPRARVPASRALNFPARSGKPGEPEVQRAGGEWPPRAWPSGITASPSANPVSAGTGREDQNEEELLAPNCPGPVRLSRAPLAGAVRSAVRSHREEARGGRARRAEGRRADDLDPELQQPDRHPPGRDPGHPGPPRPRPVEPRPPEKRAARGA